MGRASRPFFYRSRESSQIVTGPSFSMRTRMWAPKTPDSMGAPFAHERDQLLNEPLSLRRRHGGVERRTPPLARRARDREVRDEQDGSLDVEDGQVHLPRVVLEDPEIDELVGPPGEVGGRVVLLDADKRDQARADPRMLALAVVLDDAQRRADHPLHHDAHAEPPFGHTMLPATPRSDP